MDKSSDQLREVHVPHHLAGVFSSHFGANQNVRIFRAPGRVNIIGEHTDYNDGFVLPAAIDLYTWAAIAPRSDRLLSIFSENFGESAEIDLDERFPKSRDHWTDYVRGVAIMLQKAGVPLPGASLAIYSSVPLGSGLSSSAALEVSVASALLAVSGHTLPLPEVARICQRAENEFVGARVGIMDQIASCVGASDKAILLDCRSLNYELLPMPAGVTMVICNTMVKHEHSGGEYNDRRAQCEEGVCNLKKYYPQIRALRDVTLAQLEAHRTDLPELIYRRCHHVVSENERVLQTVVAWHKGDWAQIGKLMAESHVSLKRDYEVSSRELDLLVEAAAGRSGLIGARMTGGGFGGCTINLVNNASVAGFTDAVREAYKNALGIDAEIYVTTAGAGVSEVHGNA
ncbi:MAG: galactokinase [Acidobacteria bacterium]|nr:galactokinase [Acidobacteriota bacterium]MBS1864925.1 galactokinase [Acidobacteriota bacterium]